ncbi:MAG: hypothetical protein WCR56_02655 [Bacilli bacterium]|jgi:uncharacterized alkaline shock family protein YloU
MNTYFYVGNGERGKLGISVFVFQEIAEETVKSLAVKGELKDYMVFDPEKKIGKVKASIDKGQVTVDVQIVGIKGADLQNCSTRLQKEIYENIYDITEISNLKVNVSILSIVDHR